MKELEKQLRKSKTEVRFLKLTLKFSKITEIKKNEILEKQNKKLSRFRIARDSSDVSINKQTNSLPKTTKTMTVKG